MGRVADTIANARRILADPGEARWTHTRIMELYNQALINIVTQTNVLNAKVFVEIESGVATYKLPDDVLRITRVQHKETHLPVKSHEDMDKVNATWELDTGSEIEAVIMNLTNYSTFRIYPTIEEATEDYVTSNSNYGIIIDITVVEDVFNLPNIEDLESIPEYLTVYYTKIPSVVTEETEDSDLELSRAWDPAIAHFIAGMAHRDDNDSQNRALGAEELQIYANDVANIMKRTRTAFTNDLSNSVEYQGFI